MFRKMKKRERTRTASLGQRGLARRVGSVSVPRLGHGAALCRTVTLREHGAERTRGLFQPRGSRHLCLEKRVLWKEKLEVETSSTRPLRLGCLSEARQESGWGSSLSPHPMCGVIRDEILPRAQTGGRRNQNRTGLVRMVKTSG